MYGGYRDESKRPTPNRPNPAPPVRTITSAVTPPGVSEGAGEHFIVPLLLTSGTTVIVDPPAALDEISEAHRASADLSRCAQARLIGNPVVVGSAGTKLRVQYSPDQGVSWFYLDGVSGPEIELDSAGHKVSAWVGLAAGARADVWIRPVTIGGDGVTDPTVGKVILEVRS